MWDMSHSGHDKGDPATVHDWQPGLLGPLGLSQEQERVYQGVLDGPSGRLRELAQAAGISRARALTAVVALEAMGLISRVPGASVRYVAVAPEASIPTLALSRRQELERVQLIVPLLDERFAQRSTGSTRDLVEVISGRTAVSQRVEQLWLSAQQELLQFDKPPYIMSPTQPNEIEILKLQQGIAVRAVYDKQALEIPGALDVLQIMLGAGEQARTAPTLPMKLLVVDHRVGLVPLRHGAPRFESAIIVHESPLLDALSTLFDLYWERAASLGTKAATETTDAARGFPPAFGQVLTLLAMGHKEDAIARALGVNRRTVGRRITRMMEVFGVTTRLELVHRATLRGWLADDRANERTQAF